MSGWKLEPRPCRQTCSWTRSLPFHTDFLEMARGLYPAVPVPSGSQSPDPERQNVPERRGAGNNVGRVEEGHRKCGGDSLGAGTRAGGDSGTCDLIR